MAIGDGSSVMLPTFQDPNYPQPSFNFPDPRGAMYSPVPTGFMGGYANMGYTPTGGIGMGGNSYGGFGNTFQGPMAGGYIQAPRLGGGSGNYSAIAQQIANQYQKDYNEAKQTNEQRYQEEAGSAAGLPTQTIVRRGQKVPQVQINGKWVDQAKADPNAINQNVAQNSLFSPDMGGFYGRYSRGMNDLQGTINTDAAANQKIQDQYNQRVQNAAAANKGIQDQYNQRLQTAMNIAAGADMQQMQDTNLRYNNLQASAHQNLIDRGLTGSTVAPAVAAQIEGQRGRDIGNIADNQTQIQLQTQNQLSGDALNFAQNAQQQQNQLSGDSLNFGQTAAQQAAMLGQQKVSTDAGLSGDMLNFMNSRSDPYPDLNSRLQMLAMLGQYSQQPRYY